eukprot:1141265-Pleurochrysis_carterae.AAC.1
MSNKWGHPVATLPVMNGTIHHIRRLTEILRIMRQKAAVWVWVGGSHAQGCTLEMAVLVLY